MKPIETIKLYKNGSIVIVNVSDKEHFLKQGFSLKPEEPKEKTGKTK